MATREFVIPGRRLWGLWILTLLGILYFAAILWLVRSNTRVKGVETQWLVWGGVGYFALVILVMLPYMFKRRVRAPKLRDVPPDEGDIYAPPADENAFVPPTSSRVDSDDEVVLTHEEQRGFRVLEYSSPAKSTNRGAVYTKSYVPVTKEYVLRIENVAAEPHEI